MRIHRAILAFVVFAFASAQALAAPATPEGADKIAASLQTYFSKTPGVITVKPAGEAYDLTIDLAPFLAWIPAGTAKIEMSPFVMKLADQGGGKWQVSQDLSWSFSLTGSAQDRITMKAERMVGSGIFDANLMATTSSTADITNLSLETSSETASLGASHDSYAIASIHYESAATAAGGDAVDVTSRMAMSGIAQTINVPMGPGTPPVRVNLATASQVQDGTVKGLRTKAIAALVAWHIAHPSFDAIKPAQEELRGLLRAALPVFENISVTSVMQNLQAETSAGPASLAKGSSEITVNGAVNDGAFRMKLSFSGLALPPGVVPAWAAPAAPGDATIDIAVSGYDLAAPANIVIDRFDLTKNPPLAPDVEIALQQSVLPKGVLTITLDPSLITSRIAALGGTGTMTAGPAAIPAGSATVTLKGIDELIALVNGAPAEMGLQQMMAMLVVAKGMAKPGADGSLEWKIESAPTGGVTINGVDPTKM